MPPRVRNKIASSKSSPTKPTTSRRKSAASSTITPAHPYLSGNALVCGDNLDILKELPDACIDLIYLDPPFNSNQFYVAAFGDKGTVEKQLKDIWRWTVESENSFQRLPHGKLFDCLRGIRLQAGEQSPMAAYCVFMGRRLEQLHRVLKPTGSVYLHCDPHANAYLRILMDAVFGTSNFRTKLSGATLVAVSPNVICLGNMILFFAIRRLGNTTTSLCTGHILLGRLNVGAQPSKASILRRACEKRGRQSTIGGRMSPRLPARPTLRRSGTLRRNLWPCWTGYWLYPQRREK